MLEIIEVTNAPVASMCYILYDKSQNDSCLIVDPGSHEPDTLLATLKEFDLTPEFILLTHEHFDHCWGVNDILQRFPQCRIFCGETTGERSSKPKYNLSRYTRPEWEFSIPAYAFVSNKRLVWNGYDVECSATPGHSPGSECFVIGDYIFTGDAYLPDFPVATNLPGADKEKAKASLSLIEGLIKDRNLNVFPGHKTVSVLEF